MKFLRLTHVSRAIMFLKSTILFNLSNILRSHVYPLLEPFSLTSALVSDLYRTSPSFNRQNIFQRSMMIIVKCINVVAQRTSKSIVIFSPTISVFFPWISSTDRLFQLHSHFLNVEQMWVMCFIHVLYNLQKM